MDGDDRRHHQYGQPQSYQVPSSAPANPTLHMPPPAHATERYAQASVRTDTSRSSLSRPQATGFGTYGYAEQPYPASALQGGAMQGVEMQFSPTYVQDSSRPHTGTMQQQVPQQQYSAYGQNIMMQAAPTSNVYESVPHYQQRQSAAIEVLADRFGEPSYLPSNVQGGMAPAQYLTSQPEQVAFQQQLHQARPVPAQRNPQHAGTMPMSEHQYPEDTQAKTLAADTLGDEKRQYEHQLATTFEAIRAGKVNEASEKLMQISRWLLSSVVALGLHIDDPEEHDARFELWREFNLCWEALGLKQKDIIEEALRTGRQPSDMLTADQLHTMVEDLLKLTDTVEQHGLIDYEMGVAEEEIVDIFIKCLDLYPSAQGPAQGV